MNEARTVKVVENLLAGNDLVADELHRAFEAAGALAVNLIASPGAGKTSLILRTIAALAPDAVGVIEGDVAGHIDTDKVLDGGARDAVQINTGGNCHLEASMVRQALASLELAALRYVFIENVGNLICPTHWRLGEHLKVCLSSVVEGDDKPVKYPEIFAAADAVVLNKVDLIDHVDFERAFFDESLSALNPGLPVFPLSCRTGEGIGAWADWLRAQRRARLDPTG